MTLLPTSSQTVGPFFSIGLQDISDSVPELHRNTEHAIEIQGVMLDRDGLPVPDALLEFWNAGTWSPQSALSNNHGIPGGFRRVATNEDGHFSVSVERLSALHAKNGKAPAPRFLVLVFARGLLRHLMTYVRLEDEPNMESDQVLKSVPPERRTTLIATTVDEKTYRWNVRLQGAEETVFFEW